MKTIKRYVVTFILGFAVILSCFMTKPISAYAATIVPCAVDNLNSKLKHNSYLTAVDNGYMRVFYNNQTIGIEYYDNSFNIISKKTIPAELEYWGGFYKGSDAYYLVEGCPNIAEDDSAEVVRVIKYDRNWNRLGAAKITGNTDIFGGVVRYPFDMGCVEFAENNGMLYIVTGHEGYVDPQYNQGHQGFLMIAVDEAKMTGKIIDADLGHSFAQYIDNDSSGYYVLQQKEGSRCTVLSEYDIHGYNFSKTQIARTFEYGGVLTSAWAIPCYASLDGMAMSSDNILCLGTSIDQSKYDDVTSDTPHNVYLTITPKSDISAESTTVKWLTSFTDGGKCFTGAKITKINDNRFMISWSEYTSTMEMPIATDVNDCLTAYNLHYIFVDGSGNTVSKEFTEKAAISDCQPTVKGSDIVFYSSTANTVDFYTINSTTGAFSKKIYRPAGENASWEISDGTLTISGSGALYVDIKSNPVYPISSTESSFSYYTSMNAWAPVRDNVTKMVVKSGITSIGDNAFNYFRNLTEVSLESGVKSIGKEAFAFDNAIEKITIPASVTSIGEDALWTGYYWASDNSHVVRATIYTYEGSVAADYAKQNNIKSVLTALPLTNNSTISSTTITKGESVTLKAVATGGTSPYQYSFTAKHSTASEWTVLKAYNSTSTKSWTPGRTGTYQVCAKVKDSKGTEVKKFFTLTVNAPLTNNSTISSTTITKGDSVTLKAIATGGTSPYQYS
ncbi:MAG: leucine-rich repeat protein, partial [Acutalibacteraceae bacterium]